MTVRLSVGSRFVFRWGPDLEWISRSELAAVDDSTLVVLVAAGPGSDALRPGALVSCECFEQSGILRFETKVRSVDELVLQPGVMRVTFDAPDEAERVQRRSAVRAAIEVPVTVTVGDRLGVECMSVDMSEGGVAFTWPGDAEVPEVGDEGSCAFDLEGAHHDHVIVVVGSYQRTDGWVVRCRFEGVSAGARDRLTAAVFAVQRAERAAARMGRVRV